MWRDRIPGHIFKKSFFHMLFPTFFNNPLPHHFLYLILNNFFTLHFLNPRRDKKYTCMYGFTKIRYFPVLKI